MTILSLVITAHADTPTRLQGVVSIGVPIQNAKIIASTLDAEGNVLQADIADTSSANDGTFTLKLPSGIQNQVKLTATNGTYEDPFTEQSISLPIPFHAFVMTSSKIALTPVTESQYQYALNALGSLSTKNILQSNFLAENFLYGIDPTQTLPVDFTHAADVQAATLPTKVYTAALAIFLQYEDLNTVSLATLTAWQTPLNTGTCAAPPYTPTSFAIPTSFFEDECEGAGDGSTHTPNPGNLPGMFGFLSDPNSIFYLAAKDFIFGTLNYTGFDSIQHLKDAAEISGQSRTTPDSNLNAQAKILNHYLDIFDVDHRWLGIPAGGTLVNWQTGVSTGNTGDEPDCTGMTEDYPVTFCSSFVSAVVFTGDPKLFPQGSIPFLHPYNGPNATVSHPGQPLPLNQCASRDYLTSFQQPWLKGILTNTQGPTMNVDTWKSWDYSPVPDNTGWTAVNTQSTDAHIQEAIALGNLTGRENQDDLILAQRLANQGELVIASFMPTKENVPGHIAVVRPSKKSWQEILWEGPEMISVGKTNFPYASLRQAFNVHSCDGGMHANYCSIGAWESMSIPGQAPQVLFFYDGITP